MIGTALNHYRITASIGAGGMGEAFGARDTRLNGDAEMKVAAQFLRSTLWRLRLRR